MDWEAEHSPFNRIASADEVAAYDPKQGPCCDHKDPTTFRVDIRGAAKSSVWNKSCAQAFAQSFVAEYPEYKDKSGGYSLVQKAWWTHFNHLRNMYKKQQASAAKVALTAQNKHRLERQSQVGKCHLDARWPEAHQSASSTAAATSLLSVYK